MGLGSLISQIPVIGQPISDTLFGEQQNGPQFNPYIQRPLTGDEIALQSAANKAQLSGIQGLQEQKFSPEEEANINAQYKQAQVGTQITSMRQGIEDSRRQMQKQIAARGLQNTSMGFGQQMGQERNLAQAQAQAMNQNANQAIIQPLQAEQIRRQRAMELTNVGQSNAIRSQYDTGSNPQRVGGLLPFIGGALGAYATGTPQGAQMGLGAGNALKQSY